MNLTERTVGGVTVFDLAGRMTSTDGAGELKDAVARVILGGRTNIVLNLSKLSYMDSSGLGEMVACYTTASKAGGAVKLAHTAAKIQDLLTITKLITVFDTHETEQSAVNSFAVPVGVPAAAVVAKA